MAYALPSLQMEKDPGNGGDNRTRNFKYRIHNQQSGAQVVKKASAPSVMSSERLLEKWPPTCGLCQRFICTFTKENIEKFVETFVIGISHYEK